MLLLLVGGLVGAVVLVIKNQETRRGAAATTPNPVYIFGSQSVAVGQSVVMIFGVDTNSQGKMAGVEMKVKYDATKLRLVDKKAICKDVGSSDTKCYRATSGVPVLFESKTNVLKLNELSGEVELAGVVMGGTPTELETNMAEGVVQLMRLVFEPVAGASGAAVVEVVGGAETVVMYKDGASATRSADVQIKGSIIIVGVSLTPTPIPGAFSAHDGFVVGNRLYQSMWDGEGLNSWFRVCQVINGRVPTWTNGGCANDDELNNLNKTCGCTKWNQVTKKGDASSFVGMPGGTSGVNQAYGSYNSVVVGKGLWQGLLSKEGDKSWYRVCQIKNGAVRFTNGGCGNENRWQNLNDDCGCTEWFGPYTGAGRGLPEADSDFAGTGSFYLGNTLWQSVFKKNDVKSWYRTCNVTDDNIPFANCGNWIEKTDSSDMPGGVARVYGEYASYMTGGELWQALYAVDGYNSWFRKCGVANNAINWGSCGGWTALDLSDVRTGCSRCSRTFNNQYTEWTSEDCGLNSTAQQTVTRTYNASCSWGQNYCQRCSVSNQGEYVWWMPEAGKDCGSYPDATKVAIYRAPKSDCRVPTGVVTPGVTLQQCNRCSNTFNNQRAAWQAADCSLNPGAGVTVTRTYDASCQSGQAFCQRCSTTINHEYLWWMPNEGERCEQGAGSGVTVYKAGRNECVVSTEPGAWLKFRMSFAGLVGSGQCIGRLPLQIVAMGGGSSMVYTDVIPTRDTSVTDRVVYEVSRQLSGFQTREGVAVFVKGPKHLQMKYGVTGQSDFYNKAGGELTLGSEEANTPVQNFSNYPLLPGDVNQDGVINGADFTLMKADNVVLRRTDDGGFLTTDLDGDCIVTSHDMQLFRVSLSEKQSQLY